jgi:hypothetical protein
MTGTPSRVASTAMFASSDPADARSSEAVAVIVSVPRT